jgi:plasmid stabilization system protein ParE
MTYEIFIELKAKKDLQNIFSFIEENASLDVASNFLSQLKQRINKLSYLPYR